MLKICTSLSDLDFDQLCRVYGYDGNDSIVRRNKLYDYLCDDFFRRKGSLYAVWIVEGEYVSALRLEAFEDGSLLEAVQTVKDERRKGFARNLIRSVLTSEITADKFPVYAHIFKSNHASMALHYACGFRPYHDYARFIDGTVSANACTVKCEK